MIKKTLLTLAVACVAGVTASAAPIEAPTRASGGTAGRMFGYNSESAAVQIRGLYELNTTGQADLVWYDDLAYPDGLDAAMYNSVMTAGWVRNGRLCGFQSTFPYVSTDYYKYVEHDLEDGEVLREENVSVSNSDWTNFIVTAAYCPMNDRIYGFGFSKARNSFAFKSAPASDPSKVTIIRDGIKFAEFCYGITFNTNTGELIGMTPDTSIVRIDINTGVETTVYAPGFPTGYQSDLHSICYDASNNKYYCNYIYIGDSGETSNLYEIDLDRRTTSRVATYNDAIQFNFMVVDGASANVSATAPAQVEDLAPNFEGENLKGSFDFTLPVKTAGGETLEGDVDWVLYYDYNRYQSGTGKPGEKVSVNATITKGFHTIRVQCSSNGQEGLSTVIVPLLGGEEPVKPENVVMTRSQISWDAVTQGVSGSVLTPDQVTYKVEINGETVGTTKETKLDISEFMAAAANKSLEAYTGVVYAVIGNNLSAGGKSNKIVYGTPLSLPVKITPTEKEAALTQTVDANKDNVEWEFYHMKEADYDVFNSAFGGGTDDWLFLPQFSAKGAESVEFKAIFEAADETMLGGEISVFIGTAPTIEAMKTAVIPDYIINVAGEQYLKGTTMLTGDLANATELYYGIRAVNQGAIVCPMSVFNIEITEGDSKLNGPAAVTDIQVAPNETNTSKQDITFKLPTTTVAGTAIPADATIEANVYIDSNVKVSGKPGETVKASVFTHQGDNLLIITASVDGVKGAATPYVFFTGDDVPGLITDVKITYDKTNLKMTVNWNPPTEGFYGGSVGNSAFKYEVYQYAEDGEILNSTETGIGVNYAELSVPTDTPLTQFNAAVRAVSAVGACPDFVYFVGQIGTPYKLAMHEDFEGDDYLYTPFMAYASQSVQWGWQLPARLGAIYATDNDYAFTCKAAVKDATSRIDLPKFQAENYKDITLNLNLWNGENGATTKVYASSYNIEPTLVGTIECGTENAYKSNSVVLPSQFDGCSWILLTVEYEFANANDVAILTEYSISGTKNEGSVSEMETILGSVFGQDGMIVVNGYNGREIAVYSLDGKLMKRVIADSDRCAIPMSKGLYVVRAGEQATKAIVR